MASAGRARPPYRRVVMLYDRLYRLLHGLGSPEAAVGFVLRLETRRLWIPRTLPDGTGLRPGQRIGVLHLNNEHVVTLHCDAPGPLALGLTFRRRLVGSLEILADLAAPGGRLHDVKAFAATTIFHRGLARLGFQPDGGGEVWARLAGAYQRALLASLHPDGAGRFARRSYARARRLWLTREALCQRYGAGAGAVSRAGAQPGAGGAGAG